jgi:predicted O-methyltransferase YrrM
MKYDANITGFMSLTELEWLYTMALKMDSIVEIGSYEGRSTFSLLSGCKGLVYSVDFYDKKFATNETLINMIRNVGHFENFRFLKMPSEEAVKCFADASIDMVFIDADHIYDSVKSDIERWMPKTKKLICGHDYNDPGWPGVKIAVDEKFNNAGIIDTIWFKNL